MVVMPRVLVQMGSFKKFRMSSMHSGSLPMSDRAHFFCTSKKEKKKKEKVLRAWGGMGTCVKH